MTGAAFFDLDRTLLAGASGPVFAAAMRAGVITASQELPGEKLLFSIFNPFGETLPSMALARGGRPLRQGQVPGRRRAAADEAADILVGMVQPLRPG